MSRYTIFRIIIIPILSFLILGMQSCASSSETPKTLSRKFCSCAKPMSQTASKLEQATALSAKLVEEANRNIQDFVQCLGGQDIWDKIFDSSNEKSAKTLDLIKANCPDVWQSYERHYNLK